MSQLTTKHQESLGAFFGASSKAVKIPPSGPSPGQRSTTVLTCSSDALRSAATIATSEQTDATTVTVRSNMDLPSNSASALSAPNRDLPPPARTYPRTVDVSLTPHPPSARGRDAECQVRATSLANFAAAIQSSPRCVKRSISD